MDQLKRGSHAPKVTAACSKCGLPFERSAVHPYIVDCPGCRGSVRAARAAESKALKRCRCRACREMVSSAAPLGMRLCQGREPHMWWSLGNGWWRNAESDDVFRLGEFRGSLRESPFDEVFRGAEKDREVARA
jgi:hypothetical protein